MMKKVTNSTFSGKELTTPRAYVENSEIVIRMPLLDLSLRSPFGRRLVAATTGREIPVTGAPGGEKLVCTARVFRADPKFDNPVS